MTKPQILISAGEASGDLHAARLASALRLRADVELFGLGGTRMRAAGVELLAENSRVAVVGISEAVRRLPAAWRILARLAREAARRHAPLAILVDFPDFNLRLARQLRGRGVRVVYFIAPQVWAWRPGRIRLMRELVERILCIFPFEEKFFRDAGLSVDFVGHPLVDQVRPQMTRADFASRHGLDPEKPIVALLPGSRPGELVHHLPVMLEACRRIARQQECQFVLALAPGLESPRVLRLAGAGGAPQVVEGATYDAVAAADLAVVSSGTATVETALLGTPMIVVYRVSSVSAAILRRLVRTPYYSMVNLIAGRGVVPELIQEDFTAERVADEAARLLGSAEARKRMKSDLAEVRGRLGPGGAIERAAEIISGLL